MRIVRIALIVYCFGATVGLGLWAWRSIGETSQLSAQIAAAEERLDGHQQVADTKLDRLRELEARQREGRRSFSGPEAVDASYAVQTAMDELDVAEAQVSAASTEVTTLAEAQEARSRLIIPLIAGALLHLLFGVSLIRSRPEGKHAR